MMPETYLDADAVAKLGIAGDWRFGYRDFVRFSELDALQHVNNAVYMSWFETLRVLHLSKLADEAGIARPKTALRAASIEYDAPLFLNDPYLVLGRIGQVGRTSFAMDCIVWSEGEVKVTSDATLVTVDDTAKSSVPIPAPLRQILLTRGGGVEK